VPCRSICLCVALALATLQQPLRAQHAFAAEVSRLRLPDSGLGSAVVQGVKAGTRRSICRSVLEASRSPGTWPEHLPVFLSREELAKLPRYMPKGLDIRVVNDNHSEARVDWVFLHGCTSLGFDVETKPQFKMGIPQNPPTVLQLAAEERGVRVAYVFQLARLSPACLGNLSALLTSGCHLIGRGIDEDVQALSKHRVLDVKGKVQCVELDSMLESYKLKSTGLRQLVGIFEGRALAKAQQTSDWGRAALSPAQVTYAALDAVAGIQIYNKIRSLGLVLAGAAMPVAARAKANKANKATAKRATRAAARAKAKSEAATPAAMDYALLDFEPMTKVSLHVLLRCLGGRAKAHHKKKRLANDCRELLFTRMRIQVSGSAGSSTDLTPNNAGMASESIDYVNKGTDKGKNKGKDKDKGKGFTVSEDEAEVDAPIESIFAPTSEAQVDRRWI